MRTRLKIIGDVHGKLDWNILGRPSYLDVIADCEYSLQVGDMGDAETYSDLEREVDPSRHRFVPGNHDAYDCLPQHALGDFGPCELGGLEFFFVRGAFSVDKRLRLDGGLPWWPQEELDDSAMERAFERYVETEPSVVVTHSCPSSVARLLRSPQGLRRYGLEPTFESRTGRLLDRMFDAHGPELWVFGHFHRDWERTVERTTFRCLAELSSLELGETPPRGEH